MGLPAADDFLPVMIYVILRSQAPNLYLNVEFIPAARHPDKFCGEAAYFYTHLKSALTFLEKITPDQLTIDPEEYQRSVCFTSHLSSIHRLIT